MTKESLIEKIEDMGGDEGIHKEVLLADVIAIIRQHEAEPPQDVVEKVGIAICRWYGGTKYEGDPAIFWYGMRPHLQNAYREQAKAAIAAMGVTGHSTFSGKTEGQATREDASPVTPANGTLTQRAYDLITAKLNSKKNGPVILSWEDAQTVQDALHPRGPSTSSEDLPSTAKLVHLLTEEFKSLAPDEDEPAWGPEDYAIEAVRFLRRYQYEALRQQGDIPVDDPYWIEAVRHGLSNTPGSWGVEQRAQIIWEQWLKPAFEKHAPKRESACDAVDAARYRRLRILGCAPGQTRHLEYGTVMCFTNLDNYLDEDIHFHPSRGEAKTDIEGRQP